MTVVYLTEYNTRCYGVTFQINGCFNVQKLKDISNHENLILCVKPLKTVLSKSGICNMTCMSGAFDKAVLDGNTIFMKIGEEYGRHRYVYNGGHMICYSPTNDNIYKYISKMGNILTPYSTAICVENIHFSTPRLKFNKREKIKDKELFKTNKTSVDPGDYHVSNCRKYSFKKFRIEKCCSNFENSC